MASTHPLRPTVALPARLAAGVVGGLAGGVVFGLLMQMTGMLPMVAMLVGSASVAVGWLVHLAISVLLGAAFAAGVPATLGVGATTLTGLAYGLVWWVLGGLVLMPARLGMGLFTFGTAAWQSLMGHLLYGLLLGLVAALVETRYRRA